MNLDKMAENIINKLASVDFVEIRKYVIENEKNFDNDYYSLLKKICEVIFYSEINAEKRKKIFIEIADSLYKSRLVLDQEINFSSCIAKIQEFIRS